MGGAKIKAIVPWFGSKRSLGPTIAQELGSHRAYFSLGCGSMADLFAKEPSSHETAVDLHGRLINLALVLQDQETAAELHGRLQDTLCCEEIFECCKWWISAHDPPGIDSLADERCVEDAYNYFIVSWVGRNGVAGTKRIDYQMAVRWTPGGGHGGVRFRSATESIPAWHRRLRQVMILRRDMFDVLPRIDDVAETAMYVDPPYLKGTRGNAEYEHEFNEAPSGSEGLFDRADWDDHRRLAAELRRFEKARVVVSYYDAPRLTELYPDWTKRDCTRQKNLHVQNRRGAAKKDAPEVLLINGPSYAETD
jgi:DNA adenine methylase